MKTELDPQPLVVPSASVLQSGLFNVEPARTMRAEDYPWEHEIRVALPASYAASTRNYPVLWITDNKLEIALSVVGPMPTELILVSVGAGREAGGLYSPRRAYDFYSRENIYPTGVCGDFLRERDVRAGLDPNRGGGAARFLDFLIDDVRPALAAEYRMDPDDHGLEGYSAGGWFVLNALFTRPGAFAKYLCGAPACYFCQGLIFKVEEQYAAAHDDLPGKLYFGVGDGEMLHDSTLGCFSSMAKMVELLSFRDYPSLDMTVKIFPRETHETARPFVIASGMRALWGERIAGEMPVADRT